MEIVQIAAADELAQALANHVAKQLNAAIANQGEASLVVSGGSTPKPFFKALSATVLPWDKVTITLADERWVDETDADSNAAFVKRCLLQGPAAAAKFVSLFTDVYSGYSWYGGRWAHRFLISRCRRHK